jgi:RNA polymerase sigma-70 factor (ECF subfamily)
VIDAAAMGQRLVRAKAKIRDAGIAFAVPEPAELRERLPFVLDAIYAAYGTGWEDVAGAHSKTRGLALEALWLPRLVTTLVPDDPEASGLLALILHGEARRAARRDPNGAYVPLSEQDPRLWAEPMIVEAEAVLRDAARARRPGRWQLEAAIQSVHAARRITGRTAWAAIVQLYDALLTLAPATGAMVARAAALAELHGPVAGLAALDALSTERLAFYQPAWASRAHLLARAASLR